MLGNYLATHHRLLFRVHPIVRNEHRFGYSIWFSCLPTRYTMDVSSNYVLKITGEHFLGVNNRTI
jgi:hypothetical protein